MEIGNLMWPDGGCTQAYICYDDCGDLIWELTEQEWGLVYRILSCITVFNSSPTTNKSV